MQNTRINTTKSNPKRLVRQESTFNKEYLSLHEMKGKDNLAFAGISPANFAPSEGQKDIEEWEENYQKDKFIYKNKRIIIDSKHYSKSRFLKDDIKGFFLT